MTRTLASMLLAIAVAPALAQTTPPPAPQQQTPKATKESDQSKQNTQNQSTNQHDDKQQQNQQNQQPGRGQSQTQQPNRTQEQNQPQKQADQNDRNMNKSGDSTKNRQDTQGRSDAQRQTTFRAQDLRAPDIGLWFDRKAREGLVISDIASKGPITKLGFKEGDRIVSVNGKRVSREADFIDYLVSTNRRVDVIVTRDGREETIQVDPALLLEDYGSTEVDPLEQLGIIVDDRYDDRIVVWRVIPRSPAYYAGIRAGDVLATLDSHRLGTRQELEKSVSALNPGEVGVEIRRGDRTREVTVDVPRIETRGERRTALRPNVENRVERRNERSDEKRVTPLRPNR